MNTDYRRNHKLSRTFGQVIDINRIDRHSINNDSIKQTNLKQSIVINNNNDKNNDANDIGKMFKTLKNDGRILKENNDQENEQHMEIKKSSNVNQKRKSSTITETSITDNVDNDDNADNVDDKSETILKSKMIKWMTMPTQEFENNDKDRYHYHMIQLRTTYQTLMEMDKKCKQLQSKIKDIRNENKQLEIIKDEIDEIYGNILLDE
uniref:Uncharacterized protein DDB_G0287625-like n=1 Tax=Dermatophagoides pteronyssinus TaxID=6956 RepID=A0A6P6XNK3_DERPT|nr:uncharacterized protein DDB_G0287625-like [Dermatophagoides pteronyssinus]